MSLRRRRQPVQYLGPHARVLAMDRRPYEAVQALRGRRFDAEVTAPLRHRLLEMVWAPRRGQDLRTEPGDQRLAIGDCGFAKAQVLPNLRSVTLDGKTYTGDTVSGCRVQRSALPDSKRAGLISPPTKA